MPKNARDILTGLKRKGFRLHENDHCFLHLWVDDRKTAIYTKISHGEKEIGDKLLGIMARQVKLNRRQFTDLVDCPLQFSEYVEMLRGGGHVG